ncbi:hypothetical protein BJ878DRAFT_508226 [Calycina marina]|uniref:Uncharacterized protein n=1 Tax=Calycina marina TaxID=1763456 RepID=A0A9P7Z282_9HELO|nr:hypothetical protein BJ878DRAFT_508226 [Calycina marina]
MPPKFNLNSRTITAPLAAFCMASILFVYARTSIQAAKQNAKQYREADGGQINWHNETLRRHGALEKPVEGGIIGELAGLAKERNVPTLGETDEERQVREMSGKKGRG